MKLKKILSVLLGVVLVISISLVSCAAPEPTTPAAPQGVFPDYIKIGGFLSMTGPFAITVGPAEKGFRCYLNEVNEEGGVHGREIVYVVENDECAETKAILAAKKLVEREKVFFITHTFGTATTMAAIPYLVEKGIPFVAPGAGSRSLYVPFKKNIIGGAWGTYYNQMRLLLPYLVNELGFEKIAYTYYNDASGAEIKEGIERAMEDLGMTLVIDVPFERGTVDFGATLSRVRAANPDAVIIYAGTPDIARIVVQAHQIGWYPQFAGPTPACDPMLIDLGGEDAEGVLGCNTILPVPSDEPAVKEYMTLLEKWYPGVPATTWGGLGFAASKIVVEVLTRAGPNPTWDSVIAAAESMEDWPVGIGAPVTYTSTDHTGCTGAVIMKVVGGKLVPQTDWLALPKD